MVIWQIKFSAKKVVHEILRNLKLADGGFCSLRRRAALAVPVDELNVVRFAGANCARGA